MTRVNIISRYFDDAAKARTARYELVYGNRVSHRIVDFHESADGLADSLIEANVNADTARAYETKMANGGAVIVVKAGYKPLGVARTTRDLLDSLGAVNMGGAVEETVLKLPPPEQNYSVLRSHRHFLTVDRDPMSTNYHMANWPLPLTIRTKPSQLSIFDRHQRMADAIVPSTIPYKPFTHSIFERHARMANFPIGLISKRKPFTGSIFAPHARMAAFPIPLISRRKPKNRSIFPRHQRMATVPFPLLINGKTGQNALMPGAPRMANFPIGLLSSRKPFTGSIFARHARMAAFPIPLISRRQPKNRMVIPRHGRMANLFLPLVVSRSDTAERDGGKGFSFSKMIGLPTVIRR